MAKPWTRQDIDTLITFLQRDVSEFRFTVSNGGKEQVGNLSLSLHFVPRDEENLKTRTTHLLGYLRKIWGKENPLKQEYNPFEPERGIQYGHADDLVMPNVFPVREPQWGEALAAPKAKRFASRDEGIHRFKYAYIRPDGGQIVVFIY